MRAVRTVNPVGPHAAVYARMVGPVELLPGLPDHDATETTEVPEGLVMYCPACGRRVRNLRLYVREWPSVWFHPDAYLGDPTQTVGYGLDPCGHNLVSVVWLAASADPADVAEVYPPPEPSPPEPFRRRVLRLRRRRLWSIEQMARQVPCSISMLGSVEAGTRTPALPMLAKIAAAVGVSVPELLTGTEYDSKTPG